MIAWLPNFGPMKKGGVRIGSLVIDVKDFPRQREFWMKALGYVEGRAADPGDPSPAAILKDPKGEGLNVTIDRMDPYRGVLHVDLYADDYDSEVRRLLGLGATVYRPREPEDDFIVLSDPEGNLFCVVDTGPSNTKLERVNRRAKRMKLRTARNLVASRVQPAHSV